MKPLSLFILLSLLAGAGIAASRPEAVLPVAGRFIEPLLAQQLTPVISVGLGPNQPVATPAAVTVGVALPSFVPQTQDLSFSGVDEESGPSAGAQTEPSPEQTPASIAPTQGPVDVIPEAASGTPAGSPSPQPPPMDFGPAAPVHPVALVAPVKPEALPAKPAVGEPKPETKAQEPKPQAIAAKLMFGAARTPSRLASRAIGAYARGCLAGGVALPVDGPAWQAMRLSRNRNWGHPDLVKLVQRLATDAQKSDGWPGLLVGDLSQPRGGPMLTGHASHQVGLDADVWLTPMPKNRLSNRQREEMSATSMLDRTDLAVDPRVFTEGHVKLIKRAASYAQVERVLVHPAIKKALCLAAGKDRKWLGKVRPIGGHFYHFHIRIGCPPGYAGCKPQAPPTGDEGCTKEVDEWLARLAPPKTPPPPKPPGYKPPPPKPAITLAQLPAVCTAVLKSGPDGIKPDDFGASVKATSPPKLLSVYAGAALRPHLRKLHTGAGAN